MVVLAVAVCLFAAALMTTMLLPASQILQGDSDRAWEQQAP
jgi:hypothetical protein